MDPDAVALWDAEADLFDEPADHGLADPDVREAWRGLLTGLLPPPPAQVADLGCGTATLTELLAHEGYAVDGVDFSPQMVRRAVAKTAGLDDVTVVLGDAFEPPLDAATYDAVLVRHVLWAMPDPALAVTRWLDLLRPHGLLVLVEGFWSNGAGLRGTETADLVERAGAEAVLRPLDDAAYWGRVTGDERYVVTARR